MIGLRILTASILTDHLQIDSPYAMFSWARMLNQCFSKNTFVGSQPKYGCARSSLCPLCDLVIYLSRFSYFDKDRRFDQMDRKGFDTVLVLHRTSPWYSVCRRIKMIMCFPATRVRRPSRRGLSRRRRGRYARSSMSAWESQTKRPCRT